MVDEVVQEVQQEVTQVTPEQGTEQAQQSTQQEVLDWTKDKRFGSFGDKPEQAISEMYKMLKGYDKTYTPIQMAIKKYGISDHAALEKTLEEYKSLKDPNNDVNKFIDYLNPILSNEAKAKAFQTTIEKMKSEIEREQFGSHLSAMEIQQLKEAQTLKQEFEQMKQQQEVNQIKETITENLGKVEKYAKDNNLEFDKNEFLAYCRDKNVPSHLMEDVFLAKAKPFIINNETRKAEEKVLQNINQGRNGSMPIGKSGTEGQVKENFGSALDKILGINK